MGFRPFKLGGGTPYLLMGQKWDRNADWFKCGLVWEEARTGFRFEFGKKRLKLNLKKRRNEERRAQAEGRNPVPRKNRGTGWKEEIT